MRYAYDVHNTEDWGDGPVASSGYDYDSPTDALDAALDILATLDTSAGWAGIYVAGERDENDKGPQWSWTPSMAQLCAMENAEDIDL